MSGTVLEKQNTSLRLLILIGFILSAILIAGAGFWISFGDKTMSELPVIKADKSLFKVKPENPGGKNIPHQDSLVLEILEGLSENDNKSEKLRLPDAGPELPPVAIEVDDIKIQQEEQAKQSETDELNKKNTSSEISNKTTTLIKTDDKKINLTSVVDFDNKTQQAIVLPDNKTKNVQVKSPISKPDFPKVNNENNNYRVQLAAFSKQEKAKQQAAILMEKHRNRLNGIMLEVTKIDTGSSGIYWRVITQELNETLAISTCDLLKSAGQDCIVRKIR